SLRILLDDTHLSGSPQVKFGLLASLAGSGVCFANPAQEWLCPSWTSPPTFSEARRNMILERKPLVFGQMLRVWPYLAPDRSWQPVARISFSDRSSLPHRLTRNCFRQDLLGRISMRNCATPSSASRWSGRATDGRASPRNCAVRDGR